MTQVTIPPSKWWIERSYKVRLEQEAIEVKSLDDLRLQLQAMADGYIPGPDAPPLGQLSYRFELDENDVVDIIYVYFQNKHDERARFMRLARDV